MSAASEARNPQQVLRLIVAEDSYLDREGLRAALEHEDEVEVVEYCADLPSLLAAVELLPAW